MNSTESTVAVQKAIGATKALVSIANGAPWSAYMQLETDTRRIVTERMAQTILDALQQSPAAPPPADSEQTSKHEAQLQFANDEVKRYEERYRQEHENALALTNTLIRVAPDAYKELKPKLHQNVGEWDKQWSDATRWRRNAQEILWRVSAILEGGDDPEEKAESCNLLVERELDRLKEGNLPLTTEDSVLAGAARGIAERIELYNLPISGDAHFSFIHGSTRYVGDLHAPHPAPLMEALRQLALWKAGQQVAEAEEAAPVDALATEGAGQQKYTGDESVDNEIAGLDLILHNETFLLKERIAELEAERDSAVRAANKRAFLLREIEFYTDPKNRVDGETLAHKLDSIHKRIVYVTASPSAPESEATDA